MEVIKTKIQGLYIIKPRIFTDTRGYFFESFSKRDFDKEIGSVNFVQDNESCSTKGVLRGLHFQKPPYTQAKLVRCVLGSVLDVAVDLREGSPTYGQYEAVELNEKNHLQFFVPKGFAHGFEVLSDVAVFQYKCDEYYHPESEGGIDPFDAEINVEWHVKKENAIISEKDARHPSLKDFITPFKFEA